MASRSEGGLKAYRIGDRRYPLFDGGGAMLRGARWNSPGRRIVYASLSFAGAMLEVLVHANIGRIPKNHHYVEIDVPKEVAIEWLDPARLPGWDAEDCRASRAFGDAWCDSRRSAVLVVPSVVSQLEHNVLIHQEHPQFALIRAGTPEPVRWDRRLFRTGG